MKKIILLLLAVVLFTAAQALPPNLKVNFTTVTWSGDATCAGAVSGTFQLLSVDGCTPSTSFCHTCLNGSGTVELGRWVPNGGGGYVWNTISTQSFNSVSPNNQYSFSFTGLTAGEYMIHAIYTYGGTSGTYCASVSGTNIVDGYTPVGTPSGINSHQYFSAPTSADVDFALTFASTPNVPANIVYNASSSSASNWLTFSSCGGIPFSASINTNVQGNNNQYKLYIVPATAAGADNGTAVGVTTFTNGVPTATNLSTIANTYITTAGYYKVYLVVQNGCGSYTRIAYIYIAGSYPSLTNVQINSTTATSNCTPAAQQQVYACQPVTLTFNTSAAYRWVIGVQATGTCSTFYTGTTYTSNPSGLDLRSLMPGGISATTPGSYMIYISATNNCGTTGTWYHVNVLTSPSSTTSCFQFSTNNTCSGLAAGLGTSSSPITVCSKAPKISGSCSSGGFIGGSGYYSLVVDEYNSTGTTLIQNVISSLNNPVANASDIVCLNLNDFTATGNYWYVNTTGLRYKVQFTIGNACSASTTTGWFNDGIAGCKTSYDDETTGLATVTEDHIVLYPNPSKGAVHINFGHKSRVSFRIFDLQGQEVNTDLKYDENETIINTTNLAKSIYVIKFNDENASTVRFAVE